MSTFQAVLGAGAGGLVIGHFWGGTIWPWLKAKIAARLAK